MRQKSGITCTRLSGHLSSEKAAPKTHQKPPKKRCKGKRMIEWILIISLETASGIDTEVVPGFTSEERCLTASDQLQQAIGATKAIAAGGEWQLKGANAQCVRAEK